MKKIFTQVILGFFILCFGHNLYAGNASPLVEQDTNKIISIVSDNSLKGDANKDKRREMICDILEKRFDFTEMSKRAVGREWKKADQAQQKEFTDLFKNLLENTYIEKMEQYSGEKITLGKENEIGDGKVSVETFIITSTGKVTIIYKLIPQNSDWFVYDVIIEGVGLIQNYRSQFKEILDKDNFGTLINKLKEKKLK